MKNKILLIALALTLSESIEALRLSNGEHVMEANLLQQNKQKENASVSQATRLLAAAGVTAGAFYALKTPKGEKLIKLLKDNQDFVCAAASAGTITYYALGGENIFNNFKASLGFYLMKWGPASIINTGKMTK